MRAKRVGSVALAPRSKVAVETLTGGESVLMNGHVIRIKGEPTITGKVGSYFIKVAGTNGKTYLANMGEPITVIK